MQTSSQNPTPALQIRCRQIGEPDFESVSDLLHQGYPTESRGFWLAGLGHMRERAVPDGYPRYGFLLESGGRPVGVLLSIFATIETDGEPYVRCNVSSWYVDPAFRSQGAPLTSQVFRYKAATVINTSPLPHTWPILPHQGYRRYSEGQVICLPALAAGPGVRVRPYAVEDAARMRDAAEAALMVYHAGRGCLALVCETPDGLVPAVFLKRSIRKLRLPYAQLAYCRDTADFVRLAGPLGRWLLVRGFPFAVLDAVGPVPGVPGRFVKDRIPKYWRGLRRPRLNDLAYTEAVVLGL